MDDGDEEERKEEGNCVLQRRFRPLPPPPPPLPSAAAAAETTSEAATVASEVAAARSAAVPLTVADAKAQFSHKSPLLTQSELSSVLQSVEEDYTRKADFRKAYPAASAADGGRQNSFCGSEREGRGDGDLNSQVVISGPLPPPLPFPPTETESRDNNPDHSDRPDNRVLHSQGSAVILLGGEGGFPKLGENSSEFK